MKAQSELMAAFADSVHPGNGNLLRSDWPDDQELRFLHKYTGRPWWNLNFKVLAREGACLTFLSDPGLKYVLPAYVLMYVNDYDDPDGWTDRLLNVLATKGRGGLVLDRQQFELVEESLLSKAEQIGKEHGRSGSTHGVPYHKLVKLVREAYRDIGDA